MLALACPSYLGSVQPSLHFLFAISFPDDRSIHNQTNSCTPLSSHNDFRLKFQSVSRNMLFNSTSMFHVPASFLLPLSPPRVSICLVLECPMCLHTLPPTILPVSSADVASYFLSRPSLLPTSLLQFCFEAFIGICKTNPRTQDDVSFNDRCVVTILHSES